jgi:NDP-sugar pyrophosphorylase family protein
MKAVLLAAGLSTRLRPFTDATPKCMVHVAGKPLLQHNIEWLQSQGIHEIAINLHYCPETVTRFFGSGDTFGVSIHYSYEPELLGTAGSVLRLSPWLGSNDFLVLYADNLFRFSIAPILGLHRSSGATVTVALHWREDVSASGVAVLSADGRISRFVEKPRPGEVASHWVSAGLLVCKASVHSFPVLSRPLDYGRDVLPALLASENLIVGYTLTRNEPLYWIDTPRDLQATRAAFDDHTVEP